LISASATAVPRDAPTLALVGPYHRKQVDLLAIARKYSGVNVVIGNGVEADFTLATELGVEADFHCSSELLELDDKKAFKEFCDKHGLPTLPWEVGVAEQSRRVLLKPRHASGSLGIREAVTSAGYVIPDGYIAEEKVDRFTTYGIGVYAFEGSIRSTVQWVRRSTFPRRGGPSTVAEVVHLAKLDELLGSFLAGLRSSSIHGLFMIEFIQSGVDMYFLECNPRPWGSIALLDVSQTSFWEHFCADNLGVEVLRKGEKSTKKYFVNPLFEPRTLFWKDCFYTGFSAGPVAAVRYVFSFISVKAFRKLIDKAFP
jgi:hypothetical protein